MASGQDWTEVITPELLMVPTLTLSTLQGLRLNVPSPGLERT